MKSINVEIFSADGNQDLSMKLTLKKPIEACTFPERKQKVQVLLNRDPCCVDKDYMASWNWKGIKEGFLRKLPHNPEGATE